MKPNYDKRAKSTKKEFKAEQLLAMMPASVNGLRWAFNLSRADVSRMLVELKRKGLVRQSQTSHEIWYAVKVEKSGQDLDNDTQ